MKLLFIGGTGNISLAASQLAVKCGMELYIMNRGKSSDVPEAAHLIQADIRNDDEAETARKIAGLRFDCVIDWIAFTPADVERDIRLFGENTSQYIFISSASAYQKPLTHYVVTESTPLCNPYWQYSRDKIVCEELLMAHYREHRFPVTIVRPSYTYGDTLIPYIFNSHDAQWTLIDRMRKGKPIIVPGDGTSLWTMTHNSDFAKGIIGLCGNIHAIGNAFHITSDEVNTWDQITQTIAAAASGEANIIHIPTEFICAFEPDRLGGMLGDKSVSCVFDNSKIKQFVPGFCATVSFREGIGRTIRWLEAHPERCGVDNAFNMLCDRIIAAYQSGMPK